MDTSSQSGGGGRDTRRARHVYGALLVLLAGLFLLLSWNLPHLWVMLAGLLLAALAFLAVREIKWPIKLLILAVGAAVAALLILPDLTVTKCGLPSEVIIQNARAIQLALERYATDNGRFYPVTYDPVQQEGYLPKLPRNPYVYGPSAETRARYAKDQLDIFGCMQPLGASRLQDELREQLEWPGNFCYLPRIEADGHGGYTARGYSLLAFGRKYWDPGWWENARDYPVVVYYYNSESWVDLAWK